MTGAKITGRKTSDGRYALIYNPQRRTMITAGRWPS